MFLPSNASHSSRAVMRNCEAFRFSPALAMDTVPLALCFSPGPGLILEKTRLVAEELAVDGVAAPARARGITGLHREVPRDAVEQAVVVVLDLAQLEEVLGRARALVAVQVDDHVALARLQKYRHRDQSAVTLLRVKLAAGAGEV